MKYFLFLLSSSVNDLKRNKIRTLLTSLGILIGVLSVVLLIAFGLGLKNYIQQQFDNLGTNLVYVLPGKVISEGGGFQDPGSIAAKFEEKDIESLKRIPEVNLVVPVFEKNVTVTVGSNNENSQLLLSTPDIATALNLEAELGRFFSRSDLEKKSRIAVIGPKLAENLFGSKDRALGKSIRISEQPYEIIGILKPKGGGALGGPQFDSVTYIPYKSGNRINPEKKFVTLYIQAEKKELIPQVKLDIEKTLLRRYDTDDFQVIEQTEFLNVITSIFSILNSILIAIGSISLLVGGIGIMNIMYATVTERIKEIGIRRALGATKRDILAQFLSQAIFLSLFGGILGIVLAVVIVALIYQFFPAEVSVFSVFVALGVSSGIGVFFGVFPALKAANLSPIDAIRYE